MGKTFAATLSLYSPKRKANAKIVPKSEIYKVYFVISKQVQPIFA